MVYAAGWSVLPGFIKFISMTHTWPTRGWPVAATWLAVFALHIATNAQRSSVFQNPFQLMLKCDARVTSYLSVRTAYPNLDGHGHFCFWSLSTERTTVQSFSHTYRAFLLYVYVWLPWLRVFRDFSSVVTQMPG